MRLRTKLILSYALVVLIAIMAAGALALPLLQDYQTRRYQDDLDRLRRDKAEALDQTLRRILTSTNASDYPFKEALPSKTTPRVWPAEPPAIDEVRDVLARQAQDKNIRLLVVRVRDGLVLVDTESDPAKSQVGYSFNGSNRRSRLLPTPVPTTPGAKPSPNAAPTPTPVNTLLVNNTRYFYDRLPFPVDDTPYNVVVRPVLGGDIPNLFGLNQQGKPIDVIYAVAFPSPPEPNVLEDLLGPLILAGLAALVVSLVTGLLLARSISRPLVRLTKATAAVAKGDYSHTVPPEGGYELARLAESFNHMSDEVEEAQRMQRELIGNVSHELKTPLTAILGFSQAMLDGALKRPEDFAGSAGIIHGETERMIRLVNSLLDLSRLESGQIQMARHELDLRDILERAVTSFGPRAEAAEVKLVRQVNPIPLMVGDNDRLRQVFNNLIDNALKYTPAGGQITVACHSDGRYIVATVTDTGTGIPQEDLAHIFERFYQANKARSREVEGIGLGLAITREIVHAHGGKIEAQSKVGVGTRFSVMFPALPYPSGPTSKKASITGVEREKTLANK